MAILWVLLGWRKSNGVGLGSDVGSEKAWSVGIGEIMLVVKLWFCNVEKLGDGVEWVGSKWLGWLKVWLHW